MNNTNRRNGDSLDEDVDVDDEEEIDEDDLIEDRPQFRSVAMMMNIPTPPVRDPTFINFSDGRLDYADIGHHEISSEDYRFLDGSAVSSVCQTTNLLDKPFDPSILHLKPDKSSSWKNYNPDIVPFGYPLKRGFRQVNGDPKVISARISDCFRARSIQANYDKDTALARCKNGDFVLFNVRLFSGPKGSVIVHVHRMRGCGFSFRDDCFAILDAAEDIVREENHNNDMMVADCDEPLDHNVLKESVKNSEDHLLSDRSEMQMFALQHIAAITDPKKASEHTVALVSKMIMMNSEGIRKSLAKLLVNRSLMEHDEKEASERYDDKEMEEEIRNLGLTILANMMASTSNDGTLNLLLKGKEESLFFANQLMPALFSDIKCFVKTPHNASLAAKSLSLIFKHSLSARKRCKNSGSVRLLEDATRFGARAHSRLQKNASDAIKNVYEYQD